MLTALTALRFRYFRTGLSTRHSCAIKAELEIGIS